MDILKDSILCCLLLDFLLDFEQKNNYVYFVAIIVCDRCKLKYV